MGMNLFMSFVDVVLTVIAGPLAIIGAILLYFDLRIRKEGLNLEGLKANMERVSWR